MGSVDGLNTTMPLSPKGELSFHFTRMSHHDEDDEEEELLLQHMQVLVHLLVVALGALLLLPDERGASFYDRRLAWDEYCERHTIRGTFRTRMRMERESFDQLLSYIKDDLLVSETYAKKRRGSIVLVDSTRLTSVETRWRHIPGLPP
jgi:hypothetical protein